MRFDTGKGRSIFLIFAAAKPSTEGRRPRSKQGEGRTLGHRVVMPPSVEPCVGGEYVEFDNRGDGGGGGALIAEAECAVTGEVVGRRGAVLRRKIGRNDFKTIGRANDDAHARIGA